MRVTLKEAALLALPTLSNAVSISDMTPRATGLSPMCEAVYTTQIYGCTPQDFQTQQCSSSCINALYGISQAISHACVGVTGQNLVTAFLAGVGPQQLCHNAGGSTESPGPPTNLPQPTQTHWSPTIGSSTTTARKPTDTGSLLVDTSSTMTATIIPHKTQTTSSSSETAQTTSKTTPIAEQTTAKQSPTTGTTTSSAAGDSQTGLNDHSGGGSPFDTAGNMNAAPVVSLSLGCTILSAAAAMLMALR